MAPRCSQVSVASGLLSLAAVGILLMVIASKKREMPPDYMYGIVLDAGSSHTSMFIYRWLANKQNGTGIVTQFHECPEPNKKGKDCHGDGISKGEPHDAAESLKCCLNEAKEAIPPKRHKQTPLYLAATAGMRLLNITNPTKTKQILEAVKNKMQEYPFDFKKAAILSGEEEGAYGWVTVNYLRENFAKYGFEERWWNPGRKRTGALDLGGASTQITFETSEVKNKGDAMNLTLYGKTYQLYTHSYLCYGKNEFLRRLLAHLIEVTTEVSHPCYPRNDNTTINPKKDVFGSACTKNNSAFKTDINMTVVGTGDYESCYNNITKMFECPHPHCSFDINSQPSIQGNFMAFSAFYYTYDYIREITNDSITSYEQMKKAIKGICNMTLSELNNKTERNVSAVHLRELCASSNYMDVLLNERYKIPFPSTSFEKKAGGASVGWALGYMLNISNMVPEERIELMTMPEGPWAAILCILIVLLPVGVGSLVKTCRNRGSKEDMV